MAATSANVVRVFVNLQINSTSNAYSMDLSQVDAAVSAGLQDGFKVVIVFNPYTWQSEPEFWANPALQASLLANWITAAKQYAGNPTVAGYDLLNEPTAPNGESQWLVLADQLIAGIRAVDPAHAIIFEPSPAGGPDAFVGLTPLSAENIVYSVHFYNPLAFTEQGLQTTVPLSYPSTAGSPLGVVNKTTLSNSLTPVRQFMATYGVPIYVGEFSAVRWAPGTSAYNWVSDAISLFEAAGWSWNYHEWRGYAGWDAEIPESFFAQFTMTNAMPQGFNNQNTVAARTDTTDTMTLLKEKFQLNTH